MKQKMILLNIVFAIAIILTLQPLSLSAQSTDGELVRPLSEVLEDIRSRFDIKLKIEVDTAGLTLRHADSRIRPYSAYESLSNVLAPFDYQVMRDNDIYRLRKYQPYLRAEDDGGKMLDYLLSTYPTIEDWEARKAKLKQEIKSLSGLDYAMSKRVISRPVMSGQRVHDGYNVENFYLETMPGFFVTGSIYSPISASGKRPLILCPNGHAKTGRYEASLQIVPAAIARMGAVCVTYDLYGYGESEMQVGKNAHKTPEAMTMQLINGISILDAMTATGNFDAERIGAAGQSGGGTQVMLLSLLDNRIKAACPVTMVSSYFDGGCACESGRPIMRACGGTCLAELAACTAPNPMLVISVGGDWTHNVPETEYPYLQKVYDLYGAKDNIFNVHFKDEFHDFGPNKRTQVYKFFADIWGLDLDMANEEKIEIETADKLAAFGKDGANMPENAIRYLP